jgi:hypothetical protein
MPGIVSTTNGGNQIEIDNKGVGIFGDIKGRIFSPFTDPCPTCQKPQIYTGNPPPVSTGDFSAILTNIPGGIFSNITAIGTTANGQFSLNYTVNFNQPPSSSNPAYGVMQCATPLTVKAAIYSPVYYWPNQMVCWSGGTGPYQVMIRTNFTTDVWTDVGDLTTGFSAVIPRMTGLLGFIRVRGH